MFVVRAKQLRTLSHAVMEIFVDRVARHANTHYPERCAALGEQAVRTWIHYGIDRAAGYGIAAERDVCRYVNLMFELGPRFDQDPRHEELRAILQEEKPQNAPDKTDRLCRAALRSAGRPSPGG